MAQFLRIKMSLEEINKKVEILLQQVEESAAKHHILLGRLLEAKEFHKYLLKENEVKLIENESMENSPI